jgi:hypothetical protein
LDSTEELNKALEFIEPNIDRLAENLSRALSLVQIHEKLYGKEVKLEEAYKTDVLRAAVVFTHASLEDFLRTIGAKCLPNASEEILNSIPLKTVSNSGRAEKFFLGKLTKHRGKSVDSLIEESVIDYLERSNYNDTHEIATFLTSIGIDTSKVNDTFSALEQMMRRRHLIVHRADRLDMKLGEEQYADPLSPDQVNRWIEATRAFMVKVLSQISKMVAFKDA